jgi:hypothetical protein
MAPVTCLHSAVTGTTIPIQGVPVITAQGLVVYAITTYFLYKEGTVG